VGAVVPFGSSIVILTTDAEQAERLRGQLAVIGYDDVRGYASPEPAGGEESLRIEQLDARAAAERSADGALLVDVRERSEWDAAHVPGGIHMPYEEVRARAHELPLDRLIVVTTRGSASASELVINALRPFIRVIVIGSKTYGKPVGQYGIAFCDKLLAPVAFALRNADGQGDFFDGFAPDCPAPDDADHQLGDTEEGSLKEALTFATTGACSPRRLTPQRKGAVQPRALGWQSLVNAY